MYHRITVCLKSLSIVPTYLLHYEPDTVNYNTDTKALPLQGMGLRKLSGKANNQNYRRMKASHAWL